MKRKFGGGMAADEECVSPPPSKRMSIMHNTPKQWKEQRRRLLNLSRQKIKCIIDVDTNLRKSVLLNNTYKKIKHELKYCHTTETATYTPRGVFASSRRRLMMSESEWDREPEEVTMEMSEDDIESKTLNPPPKDVSLVLSDILGEEVEKSCDQKSCDVVYSKQEQETETVCNETNVAMDTSVKALDTDGSTAGNQPKDTSDEHQLTDNSEPAHQMSNNTTETQLEGRTYTVASQISSLEEQTEALNLTVVASKLQEDSSVQCDTDICDMRNSEQKSKTSEPTINQLADTSNQVSKMAENDFERSDTFLHLSEPAVMDCEDVSEVSIPKSSGSDAGATSTDTNDVDDFVISPRVSQWKQSYQSHDQHVTSLTFLPMFDLPILSCPSLQTSNLIPKLLHQPVATGQVHENKVTNIQKSKKLDMTEHWMGFHSDSVSDSEVCELSIVQGDSVRSDPLQDETNVCSEKAENVSFDSEANQHLWACFQQFNMAIACS